MHYLGIDWGAEKHGLCLMADDGRVLAETTISHSANGFQELEQLLVNVDQVAINIERPNGLLVDWLVREQYPVYVTSPMITAHRRPRRSKDDRSDAYLLARLLRGKDPDCHPLVCQSPKVIRLQQLIKAYEDLLQEHRRYVLRLRWLLHHYYPTVLNAFATLYSNTFLTFLEEYPTPKAARKLSIDELSDFLAKVKYPHRRMRLAGIYAALQEPLPPAAAEASYVEVVSLIVPRLRGLVEQRKYLTRRISRVFRDHPDAAWWRSIPGAQGPLTSARLLASIGDNRQRFPTPQVLQATAGTVPITRRSGKQLKIEFRQACSKPMRHAFDQLAHQSIRRSTWARAYFYDQLARGHSKPRAFRALANRWASIIWKLWQTNEPYDEAKHIANRSRRGQPQPV